MQKEVMDAVFSSIDALQDEMVNAVSTMVKYKSVSPVFGWELEVTAGQETAVNEYALGLMDAIGLKTEMFATKDERMNLCGVFEGSGGGKSLLFNGHVDVVPPGDPAEWQGRDPFGGEISDGYIYGRGTVDMKGGLAAALFALKGVLNAGYKPGGNVVYQFAVGEENKETEAGTGACLDKGYLADAAIVCEPSCMPDGVFDVAIAQSGVFEMTWSVKGKSCHVGARREVIRDGGAGDIVGVDAIEKGMIIYNAIKDLERRWGQTKQHPMFKPGSFNISAATIKAGVGASFVAPEMEMSYGILYNPNDGAEKTKQEIEEVISNACLNDPWLKANPPKVTWTFNWPSFNTSPDEPISVVAQNAVRAVVPEGGATRSFFAVSDGCFIEEKNIPIVVMGPGDCFVAHTVNERVSIEQLVQAAKIYAATIADWCGIAHNDGADS